jgi:hypothetical protein
MFINHHGIKKYLTGIKIAKLLQLVAQNIHPNMTREEISCFSLHPGCVWAVVLLDKAGMPPEFIKFWLRYLSNAYRLYLPDTSVIQNKMNQMILPDIVPLRNDMGEYTSKNSINQ